ncbi:hypothetical protein COLO4_10938 [Corchorus olitorius]|uniref:DUF674 domain-containing protein n=1 Tax=Corchorus olitorius TaxID=93759 RepID=A0A1R3K6C4_9ROSI|nr:hypothetical protein COLO4_10938 [Corchorus olitorius]
MASSLGTVGLKLVIDTKGKMVLYAEARKDFVDFLFNILSLPVGTVTRLLPKQDILGCLGELKEGLENLCSSYIEPSTNKDALLKLFVGISSLSLLLPNLESQSTNLYICKKNSCPLKLGNTPNTRFSSCNHFMRLRLNVANISNTDQQASGVGFVKAVATYMVMDNLIVKPLATASVISLLNESGVQYVGAIEEKEVKIGTDEGLKLLKICLQSKTVLTDLFLREKVGEK